MSYFFHQIKGKLFLFTVGIIGIFLILAVLIIKDIERIVELTGRTYSDILPLIKSVDQAQQFLNKGFFVIGAVFIDARNAEDYDVVRKHEADFRHSMIHFDMFINAVILGSESPEFMKMDGGLTFAEWQKTGLSKRMIVKAAPKDIQQLAKQADSYYREFSSSVLKTLASYKKALRLELSGKNWEVDVELARVRDYRQESWEIRQRIEKIFEEIDQETAEYAAHFFKDIRLRQQEYLQRIGIFSLLVIICVWILSVRFGEILIVRPIHRLQEGIQRISDGQLETTINISSKDEFGQLAQTFNEMVKNLHHVTASRNELNQEIVQRKQVEEDLKNSYEELKQTQSQLLQSEKLASIGQLAAGVAHEINNPVGFIGSNMDVLGQYVADYGKILKMMERLKAEIEQERWDNAKGIVREIDEFEKAINLDYVVNDVDVLLQHNQKGIERIQKIVSDLLTFSREDNKDTLDVIKIEEVIDSILSMVHNELKYKAEFRKDYGETPMVKCNSQRMGQVFINLLVNATHAIEDKGKITIKTYQQEKFVCVDITDTGKGISADNLKKIFDPFFTTKPVGQGTGLGLSVSYEIIKKHGGEIRVSSTVGKGTIFTVMLPVG